MESTPEKCAVKWKTLRDKYIRELKKVKGKRSGDAGPGYTSALRLYCVMEFYRDFVKHRQQVQSGGSFVFVHELVLLLSGQRAISLNSLKHHKKTLQQKTV